MSETFEVNCPLCGEPFDFRMRTKEFFGQCQYCGFRGYVNQGGMDRALDRVKKMESSKVEAARNDRKAKANA